LIPKVGTAQPSHFGKNLLEFTAFDWAMTIRMKVGVIDNGSYRNTTEAYRRFASGETAVRD